MRWDGMGWDCERDCKKMDMRKVLQSREKRWLTHIYQFHVAFKNA